MKHFIQIDDKNKTAKQVLLLLRELSKTNAGVGFISAEEVEDKILLTLMKQGLNSGLADKKRVLKKLGISRMLNSRGSSKNNLIKSVTKN